MTRLAALLLPVLACGGCGYQTGSLMPGGIEAVAVEVFANETRYRQPEVLYTRLLTRELVRRAHVKIRDPERAQAVIRGRILSLPRIVMVEDDNDRILEGAVVATVEVNMVDARSGQPLMPMFRLTRRAEYIVPRGETIQSAIDEAMRDLAQDTVNRIQAESFLRSRVTN